MASNLLRLIYWFSQIDTPSNSFTSAEEKYSWCCGQSCIDIKNHNPKKWSISPSSTCSPLMTLLMFAIITSLRNVMEKSCSNNCNNLSELPPPHCNFPIGGEISMPCCPVITLPIESPVTCNTLYFFIWCWDVLWCR